MQYAVQYAVQNMEGYTGNITNLEQTTAGCFLTFFNKSEAL